MNLYKTTVFLSAVFLSAVSAFAEGSIHKIAFHVDQNVPKIMNLTLNNVQNVRNYYISKGDTVVIEVVAYGPGLKMFTADSPVKDRISIMSLESDDVQFSACANTHRKMTEKAGKEIKILSDVKMTPSGVVRLVELQESEYAYVKP